VAAIQRNFTRHAQALDNLVREMRSDKTLVKLDTLLIPVVAAPPQITAVEEPKVFLILFLGDSVDGEHLSGFGAGSQCGPSPLHWMDSDLPILGRNGPFSKGVGVAMPGPTAATFDVSVTGDLGSRVKRLSRRSPTPVPSSVASPQSVF